MHGILLIAIKAAETGNRIVRRQQMGRNLRKLAPMPVSTEPGGTDDGRGAGRMLGKRPVAGKKGKCRSHEHVSDPLILYDLCTPETENE
ncbi:MAG: hypothetical protein ACLR6I_00740 [Waltera sp.]